MQPAVFGIEIDRNFRCALGRRLERAKPGNLPKARHICRRNLEFQLDFLGNWHGASPNGLRRKDQEINREPSSTPDELFARGGILPRSAVLRGTSGHSPGTWAG